MTKNARFSAPRTIALGTDTVTDDGYWIVEFTRIDGDRHQAAIPFTVVAKGNRAVCELLAAAGYPVSPASAAQTELVNSLIQRLPKKRVPVFGNVGWSHDAFCLPRCLYGSSKADRPLLGPDLREHRYAVRGTLGEWQENVADLAHGNRIAMFAICAAFAGPLMHLLNAETGGFMLVNDSSRGKSTVGIVAGSVWGGGGEHGFADSCLMTANASDLIAAGHNDTFLVLDESKLGENDRSSRRDNLLLDLAHRLAAGEEKARHTDAGPRRRWRLLYLVTSEKTLDQLAKGTRQELSTGQRVRLVDIRADGGAGMGVWEELHTAAITPAQFSDRIQEGAKRYYGSAADAFLRRLVRDARRDEEGLKAWLTARVDRYLKASMLDGAASPMARVAKRFALVYAAGCLAARYGVLKWSSKEIRRAVGRCHRLVVSELTGPESSELPDGVAAVRDYLRRHRKDFIRVEGGCGALGTTVRSAVGFRHSRDDGTKEFLIEHRRFRDEICGSLPPNRVLKDLARGGYLNTVDGGKRTVQRTLPRPIGRRRFISVKPGILRP